jgi:hypothetical protein
MKPCPFCKSSDLKYYSGWPKKIKEAEKLQHLMRKPTITCRGCGIEFSSGVFGCGYNDKYAYDVTVQVWNTRVFESHDHLVAENKQLHDMIYDCQTQIHGYKRKLETCVIHENVLLNVAQLDVWYASIAKGYKACRKCGAPVRGNGCCIFCDAWDSGTEFRWINASADSVVAFKNELDWLLAKYGAKIDGVIKM